MVDRACGEGGIETAAICKDSRGSVRPEKRSGEAGPEGKVGKRVMPHVSMAGVYLAAEAMMSETENGA